MASARTWARGAAAAVLAAYLAAAPAAAQDSPAARQAIAERYADLMEIGKSTDEAIQDMARSLPAERRANFVEHMARTVDIRKIRGAAVSAMVQVFTLDELNAAVAFWSSPSGRSMIGKLPRYQAAAAPAMVSELDRAAAGFR